MYIVFRVFVELYGMTWDAMKETGCADTMIVYNSVASPYRPLISVLFALEYYL